MARAATSTVNWAVEVASRMRGADFPLEEDEARTRLKGLRIGGLPISDLISNMKFPIHTPAGLLHQISEQAGNSKSKGGRD